MEHSYSTIVCTERILQHYYSRVLASRCIARKHLRRNTEAQNGSAIPRSVKQPNQLKKRANDDQTCMAMKASQSAWQML